MVRMGRRLLLEDRWARWVFAVCAFAVATAINVVVQPMVQARIPLLPYFPVLVLTGLCAGGLPAMAVAFVGGLTVLAFWPLGVAWPPSHPSDLIVISFSALAAAMVIAVSSWSRHLLLDSARIRHRLSIALAAGQMTTWDWNLRTGAVSFSAGAEALFGEAWTTARAAAEEMHPDDAE